MEALITRAFGCGYAAQSFSAFHALFVVASSPHAGAAVRAVEFEFENEYAYDGGEAPI
jgi:hypothetical protein